MKQHSSAHHFFRDTERPSRPPTLKRRDRQGQRWWRSSLVWPIIVAVLFAGTLLVHFLLGLPSFR
jgi:hypothetical protein